jgi:hypothetical protein
MKRRVQSSMSPLNDGQALFLVDDGRGAWRRTPIGLWFYAGLGVARIILSGMSIVLLRRR